MTIITLDFPLHVQQRELAPPPTTELIRNFQPTVMNNTLQNTTINQDVGQTQDETNFKSDVINTLKTGIKQSVNKSLDATEESLESITQHKYARLAQASYDYFQSKGNPDAVAEGLTDPKYSYIEDLSGFEMDKELSNIDNLVLHNPVTNETVVSYRGSTINITGETKNVLRDWKTNAQIAGGKTNTERVKAAERQMDSVIAKYGRENLSTTGHSQGGHVSFEMGTKYDIPSYSYNPAINAKQAAKVVEGEAEHLIYKTPLDFASVHAYKKIPKTTTKIVANLKGKDSIIDTHSLDQFTPEVEEIVSKDAVKVVRRTMSGSVIKGVSHVLNAAAYGYTIEQTISEDVKSKQTALKTGLDIAKETERFVVDGEIIGAAFAAAPETLGASLVVGAAAVMIHDMVGDVIEEGVVKGANVVAQEVKSLAHTSQRAAKKVSGWFARHLGL